MKKKKIFFEGVRDGIPIALGYFAVSFSLGIMAKKAGLTWFQGLIVSMFNNASAGEYAGFTVIAAGDSFVTMALITFITNARYLLMSTALSQKFDPKTGTLHRILVGFDVTDEIFGISIARPGMVEPLYNYGAMSVCLPGWSIGTALGIVAGSVLPLRFVSALSVSLYGMFIAIIVPPARKDKFVAGLIVVCFALSYVFHVAPILSQISSGTTTIILTVALSAAAALIKPVKEAEADAGAETAEENSAVTEKEVR